MPITMDQIKQLRDLSGAGISDCKSALEATNGDMQKAFDELRKKGVAKLAKRSDKSADAGFIGTYLHSGQILGVVVLNCETDFVAKGETFQNLARELAMQVVSQSASYVDIDSVPQEVKDREIALAKEKLVGKPEEIQNKIIEGNLHKFYEQTVLLEQVWIKDESKKVKDLFNEVAGKTGEKIVIKEICRITI